MFPIYHPCIDTQWKDGFSRKCYSSPPSLVKISVIINLQFGSNSLRIFLRWTSMSDFWSSDSVSYAYFVKWEPGVSKSHACFAAGSLLLLQWGCQREPQAGRGKRNAPVCSLRLQHGSGLTASRQQQHLSLQQQCNPVCRLLTPAKATFLHFPLETPAMPTWGSPEIWVPEPLASSSWGSPQSPSSQIQCFTPNLCQCYLLG